MSQTACSIMNVCSWAQADSFNKKNPRSKVSWQRLFPIKVQTENRLYSMLHKNITKLKNDDPLSGAPSPTLCGFYRATSSKKWTGLVWGFIRF